MPLHELLRAIFSDERTVVIPADSASHASLEARVTEVLNSLTDRERKVLGLRFGLEDGRGRTLEEVGREFQVTRERIRQIEAKALRKLRHRSRSRKLKDNGVPGARDDSAWLIIGQERAVAVLRRAVQDPERLSHAYLFAGPEHVGRATAARRFAQALNCEASARSFFPPARPEKSLDDIGGHPPSPPPEGPRPSGLPAGSGAPCGHCRTCRLIAEDKHPDVEWVTVGGVCEESEHRDHAADGSRDIRICQLRRIERVVSRTTVDARYRVVIIDPAEAMTVEAANAFLKTLEEPAPNTVLILIAAREELLRETVRSRCRRIAFGGMPRGQIEQALRDRWGAGPEQASRLARLAQGRLGWAVSALQDERLLIDRERTLDEIESVLAGGFNERFGYASGLGGRFSRDPDAVRGNLERWLDWWRDVLVTAAGRERLVVENERLDTLRAHAAQYGVVGAVQALAAISDGRRHLEEHASPTLAMEVMLLEVPSGRPRR